MDLLEDDDEFEEFEIDQGMRGRDSLLSFPSPTCRRLAALLWRSLREASSVADSPQVAFVPEAIEWDDKEDGDEAIQQWEDDWDDDDVNDDFSLQLRKELEECNTQKS
ncbi:hypothetical protein E2562_001579 [Oryza meyeriana var. granulata]|uniref:26S proteasome complex subunit SEM1 n=1 Tax=Oryza meyeriana var. granulata TaxID=110450 RepID=A0A6G1CCF7_9ORYZ|nr:hypothetical protein E2562_001579 [Oryza meyeriana var. granulata]